MIRKNVASQVVYLPALLLTADGAAVTSGATMTVSKDGTEAGSAGTLAHSAGGVWKYTPTQGETNCGIMALILTATNAMPVVLNLVTTAADTTATAFGAMASYTQPTGFLAATFPTTVASTTNITAGTITTTTNLTNLPGITAGWITAAGIAADAITAAKIADGAIDSATFAAGAINAAAIAADAITDAKVASDVTIASVTGAVGSVTAAVTLPTMPTDWVTAAGLAADAVAEIQSGLATPTNITAGTITTVTNLTNAPTAGDLTATMKTSVTTAATAATPNLNAAYDAAKTAAQAGDEMLLSNAAIGEDQIQTSAVDKMILLGIASQVSVNDLPTNAELVTALAAADDAVLAAVGSPMQAGSTVVLTATTHTGAVIPTVSAVTGLTASNLDAAISTRASQTSVNTIDDFLDTEIAAIKAKTDNLPASPAAVGSAMALTIPERDTLAETFEGAFSTQITELSEIWAKTDPLTFTVANQVDANALTGGGGGSAPTVEEIRAEMDTNSTKLLAIVADTNELQTNQGNWVTATGFSTHSAADVVTALGTGSTLTSLATQASVNDLPTNAELATSQAAADDATLSAIAALNNLSAVQVNAEVDSALADVGLTTTITGRIDAAVSTRASQATLDTLDDYVDSEVSAIKTKTDQLTFTIANQVDANALTTSGSSGSGPSVMTFTVTDSVLLSVIQGATVQLDGTGGTAYGQTNASGVVVLSVADGTYTLSVIAGGYLSSTDPAYVVSGSASEPIALTPRTITLSDPSQTTGTLTVYTHAHVAVEGAIVDVEILRLANGTTGSGINDPLATGATDSAGYVEFVGLPRLATYRVRIDNGKWYKSITLDAAETPLVGSLGPAVED